MLLLQQYVYVQVHCMHSLLLSLGFLINAGFKFICFFSSLFTDTRCMSETIKRNTFCVFAQLRLCARDWKQLCASAPCQSKKSYPKRRRIMVINDTSDGESLLFSGDRGQANLGAERESVFCSRTLQQSGGLLRAGGALRGHQSRPLSVHPEAPRGGNKT